MSNIVPVTYRVNSDYWRVLDSGAGVQKSVQFSGIGEKALRKAMLRNGGLRFLRTAAGASSTTGLVNGSTTLTSDTTLRLTLAAGVWYEVKGQVSITQATAADGYKLAVGISGTQTSAVTAGWYQAMDFTNNTVDETKVANLSSNLVFTATGTGAGGGLVSFSFRVKLQNDGNLDIQLAEQATAGGGAGAIIAAGSILEVSVLR